MTHTELMAMLEETSFPIAYDHFAEGESPDPPFICFLYPGSDNFAADGAVYLKVAEVHVELYTDSQYIANAINEHWLTNWVRRNWRRQGGPVKNADLWQRLVELLETHDVDFVWVKGHAENELNNRCDELAVAERLKFAPQPEEKNG